MDKITVVVIDNIHEVEEAVHAYAIANPVSVAKMFKLRSNNIVGRKWGEDTRASDRIVKGVIDQLLMNDVTVVVIAHMKDKWGAIGQLEVRGHRGGDHDRVPSSRSIILRGSVVVNILPFLPSSSSSMASAICFGATSQTATTRTPLAFEKLPR